MSDWVKKPTEQLFCFQKLTAAQCKAYKVSGKTVRMDSKLISSKIVWYSRYEIIHKTLLMSVDKGVASRISDQLVRLKAEVMTVIKVKDDKWKIPVKTKEGKDTYRYFGCKYSSGDVTTKN